MSEENKPKNNSLPSRKRKRKAEKLIIPEFEGEIQINYPPDEDEPDAGLFRDSRSTEFRNTPCLQLITPLSRRIPCTPREYLEGRTKDSPYRKKDDNSPDDESFKLLCTPATPMTTYAQQHSLYLASIQGAKEAENLRSSLRQKRLFSPEDGRLSEGNESNSVSSSNPQMPNLELFRGAAVFVEVFTNNIDVSMDFVKLVKFRGGTIRTRLSETVTHVVFQEGSVETYKKARQLRIPIVTILWVEACLKQNTLLQPDSFVPRDLDDYNKFPHLMKIKGFHRRHFERRLSRRQFLQEYNRQYSRRQKNKTKNDASTTSVKEVSESPKPSGSKEMSESPGPSGSKEMSGSPGPFASYLKTN